jgi:WD40 repeat protein
MSDEGRASDLRAKRMALEAFERAVSREGHNLSRWPSLLWQQLHNRLQWEAEPVRQALEPERHRRSAPGSSAWMRTRTPFRESRALLRTLAGHAYGVQACAVAPDGSAVVSASAATLEYWAPGTGRELRTILSDVGYMHAHGLPNAEENGRPLRGHSDFVSACEVAPDGSFVASVSIDNTLRLWDPATGEELRTFWIWGKGLDCAVAPDASFVVAVTDSKETLQLQLWDLAIQEETLASRSFQAHTERVSGCAVAPDGSFVVSASDDKTLKLWDPDSGEELRTLQGHDGPVLDCAVAPDGSFVVSASDDKTLKVWNPATGEELATLAGHTDTVRSCAVAPDASFVVSASEDKTLKLWNPATGEELQTLTGHTKGVTACAVAPDGSFVISGSDDKTVKLWDPNAEEEVRTGGHEGAIRGCAVAPDGSFAVSASDDKTLKLWDPATGQEIRTLEGHTKEVIACSVAPNASILMSLSWDHTLKLWDPGTGETLRTLQVAPTLELGNVRGCSVFPDGAAVVTVENHFGDKEPKLLKLLDLATGRELRTLKGHTDHIWSCAVAADGSFVVSAGEDKTVRVWDPGTGRQLLTLEGHSRQVNSCAVAPDASFVVSASDDNTLRLWDPHTGEALRTLRGHSGNVNACAVSPDGSFVFSASEDHTLKVWDGSTGDTILSAPLVGELESVAVHPSRPLVISGDQGGNVYLIDLVGIEYGPIIVTAIEAGGPATVRCPKCWQQHLLDDAWRGQVIDCPTPACDLQLRVNPSVAGSLISRPRRRLFGRGRGS